MFDIGFIELVVVATIALLVIGPERLPAAASALGRWVGIGKSFINNIKSEIEREVQIEELKEQLKQADHAKILLGLPVVLFQGGVG